MEDDRIKPGSVWACIANRTRPFQDGRLAVVVKETRHRIQAQITREVQFTFLDISLIRCISKDTFERWFTKVADKDLAAAEFVHSLLF